MKKVKILKLYKGRACSKFPSLERGDKGSKLRLLSAKMATPFLSRCESLQGFTGLQACSSGRQNLLSEDFEGESGMFSFKKARMQ